MRDGEFKSKHGEVVEEMMKQVGAHVMCFCLSPCHFFRSNPCPKRALLMNRGIFIFLFSFFF